MLFLLLLPMSAFAQDSLLYKVLPIKEGKVIYEMVIEVDSVNKNDLYLRTKSWGLSAFVSQKDALQLDDKESGIIAYKTFFTTTSSVPFKSFNIITEREFWHLIKIFIKDNKVKIVISDINIKERNQGSITYTTTQSIEEAAYTFDHPADMPKSPWVGKKFEKDTKDLINKQREGFINDCTKAHLRFEASISLIKEYLEGKKKIESDF